MWEEAADCLPGMQQNLDTVQEQAWCLRQQAEAMQATQAQHTSSLDSIPFMQAVIQVYIGYVGLTSCADDVLHKDLILSIFPACHAPTYDGLSAENML